MRIPLILFLVCYVAWTFYSYRDYGIAIDEPLEYGFGEMMYNRTFGRDPVLLRDFAYKREDSREIWAYNHFHKMFLYVLNDIGSIEMYHLLNMLFAIVGYIAAYELVLVAIGSAWPSLLGPLFLATLPRFFGHVPFNVKDPVFAIYYLLALLAVVKAKDVSRWWLRIIVLGIAIGLAAAMRTVGYGLLIIYGINELMEKRLSLSKLALELTLVALVAVGVHALEMPYVASDPVRHLPKLLHIARDYPWEGTMLYRGVQIASTEMPWHYPLVWFLVTTPVVLLMALIVGVGYATRNRVARVMLIAITANMVMYFLLRPVIYDGIRHLMYILTTVTLLGAIGAVELWRSMSPRMKVVLATLLSFHLIVTVGQYMTLHPYEYTYFNEYQGFLKGSEKLYETDYWGLSYAEGAQWLLSEIGGDSPSRVGLCGNPYAEAYFEHTSVTTVWIPRCENVNTSDVEYVMAMGRNDEWDTVNGEVVYAVSRQSVPLMKVFRME